MTSPFDHRPDHELGAELRAALDPGDQHAFVDRVTAAAGALLAEPPGSWWGAIASWARPGMAAALVLVAASAAWLGMATANGDGMTPLDDPLGAADEQLDVPVLLADEEPPDMDYVLGVALGR